MVVFLSILTNFVFFCFGYLIGSLNTSIIIGKLFYKVDIRTFHSGNAGSTNAQRVFGSKISSIILTIDIFKSILSVVIAFFIQKSINDFLVNPNIDPNVDFEAVSLVNSQLYLYPTIGGLGNVVGHIFPLFYNFKGGKGVASTIGVLATINIILVPIFLLIYYFVLWLKKYVSLASCSSVIITGLFILIPWIPSGILGYFNNVSMQGFWIIFIVYLPILFLVCFAHRENFVRIINKTERKKEIKFWK
ncbi:glycerol-3-phosphate 1-O-acyltransferase PlsY [Mycoplasmopsis felis]|uniref:glycerol-3-phosphate 1-O-acyltransferase PlsY n=1 Tax=Mycoplasmopsis felis TaxID=33923 RepID=UPI003A4D7534